MTFYDGTWDERCITGERDIYWYKRLIRECPLCGWSKETRTRIPNRVKCRPDNPADRVEVIEVACESHFL